MDDTAETELMEVEVSDELRQLLRKFPLPAGVPDMDMNQHEMAKALGVTTTTMGKWLLAPGFPIAQDGGQGKPYVLRLSHCHAWRESRKASEEARDARVRESIEKMQATFLGLDLDDQGAMLTVKDRRALAEADIIYSKAAQMRRQLVQLEELVDMLENVFKIIRDGIESMPDRLERELGLRPEQVAMVVRISSDILQQMSEEIEAAELREKDIADVDIDHRLLV